MDSHSGYKSQTVNQQNWTVPEEMAVLEEIAAPAVVDTAVLAVEIVLQDVFEMAVVPVERAVDPVERVVDPVEIGACDPVEIVVDPV